MGDTTRPSAIIEYAALHRRAESGNASDDVWRRLTVVCIELGKRREAVDAHQNIKSPTALRAVKRDLARLGWIRAQNEVVTETELRLSPLGRLRDACSFLIDGPVQWLSLALTFSFPLAMAVCGLLGGAATMSIAIACSVGLFGVLVALACRVFELGVRDAQDSEELPDVLRLLLEAPRQVVRTVTGFARPPYAILRIATADFAAVAGLCALMMIPAATAWVATAGSSGLLALALIGPLLVMPVLVTARILGLPVRYQCGSTRPETQSLGRAPRRLARSA